MHVFFYFERTVMHKEQQQNCSKIHPVRICWRKFRPNVMFLENLIECKEMRLYPHYESSKPALRMDSATAMITVLLFGLDIDTIYEQVYVTF